MLLTIFIFPADVRRMDMQDKEQYEKIRETLGEHCGMVELCQTRAKLTRCAG